MITFFSSHFSNRQSCSNLGKNENIKLPSLTIVQNKIFGQVVTKSMINSQQLQLWILNIDFSQQIGTNKRKKN